MLELTADNALDYLRAQGWVGPGPARVEALGGGVSNIVLRVGTADETFVLKQSRPQLRTRDAWFSDLDRVYREQEVMELLEPLLPPLTVPRVLHSDRANYVFAMSHAPDGSRVWKESLLAGEVDLGVGERAGTVLGRMHEATATHSAVRERFGDHTVFVQLRVDPFYRRVQERRREVAWAVEPLVEQLLTRKEALCHGDYSPKNILTHEHGFTLVDYETAHHGDPTMDLGFFLSHLVLKAVKQHRSRAEYLELTRVFWRGYAAEARFRPAEELQARGCRHFAVCLLARIDGTSPVDYLPEEPKREAVRRLGRRVLLDGVNRWEDVLAVCDEECRSLSEGR
jgi:5-methylthioribose kinase